MRRFFSSLLTIPLTIAALVFALNNRAPVVLDFWPFGLSVSAPLYLFFLGTLFCGFLFGCIITWLGQHPHRATRRRLEKRVAELEKKLATIATESTTAASGSTKVTDIPPANSNLRVSGF